MGFRLITFGNGYGEQLEGGEEDGPTWKKSFDGQS